MKVLAFSIVLLLIGSSIIAYASVIGVDCCDDIVAVYHFNAEVEGFVIDYGKNGVTGVMQAGASLIEGKYSNSLSLTETTHQFRALSTNAGFWSFNKFSIVAWVKIPNQENDFYLTASALNKGTPLPTARGIAQLIIKADGNLQAIYANVEDNRSLDIETEDQNLNNDTWHHIAFTVSNSHIRLYFNGDKIAEEAGTSSVFFLADGTSISIGKDAIGSVDDAGFFDDAFSDADIKLIYDVGLESIISIASVEPGNKATTTWSAIKSRQ